MNGPVFRRQALFADPATEPLPVPAATASFAEKRAYYRSLHTSLGVRATHLVGIPMITLSLPLLLAKPKRGIKVFALGWGLQLAGHRYFEHNSPAIQAGPITYQLVGLAVWAEDVVTLIARGLEMSDASPLGHFHVTGTTTTSRGKIFEVEKIQEG